MKQIVVTARVNGEEQTCLADPRDTLLEILRDRILREGGDAIRLFCEQSGASAQALTKLLEQIRGAPSDRIEKGLRRQLFRMIHDALMAAAQDDRISR